MNRHILTGPVRTSAQDPEFPITQLNQLAARALSPGINDPGTAVSCIDSFSLALAQIVDRDLPVMSSTTARARAGSRATAGRSLYTSTWCICATWRRNSNTAGRVWAWNHRCYGVGEMVRRLLDNLRQCVHERSPLLKSDSSSMDKAPEPGQSEATPTASPPQGDQLDLLSCQAQLASDARSASLRALSGRLAHQIRNPLAAVRAACSGLRAEIQDADQRETLDLTLVEIDRMLGFVKATVQTIPDASEKPEPLDVGAETADVVEILRASHTTGTQFRVIRQTAPYCSLPRHSLRAAVYSILDHLAEVADVDAVDVDIISDDGRVQVRFSVVGGMSSNAALATGMMSPTGWVQPVGLLVAERFARDHGGCMLHANNGENIQTFTLDLPCSHE